MDNDNTFPKRKRNRLKDYDYSSNGAYFITICTKDRKNIFRDKEQPDFVGEDIILPSDSVRLSPYGKIAEEAIKSIPKYYSHIELLQYVVMPNHVHMILLIPYDNGRMISPYEYFDSRWTNEALCFKKVWHSNMAKIFS